MSAIAISLFFIIVLLLIYACYSVIKSAGVTTAYIGFCWIPLVLGIIWMKFEYHLSSLNPLLPLMIVCVSLLLSFIVLPLILIIYWKKLPASKIAGMVAAALLYGAPAFLYITLSITGTR